MRYATKLEDLMAIKGVYEVSVEPAVDTTKSIADSSATTESSKPLLDILMADKNQPPEKNRAHLFSADRLPLQTASPFHLFQKGDFE